MPPTPGQAVPAIDWARAALLRGLAFACVWAALTSADTGGLGFGLVFVPLTTLVSLRMLRPGRRVHSWSRLLLLAPVLAAEALRSGTDVAVRALKPSLPLDPGWLEVPVQSRRLRYAMAYILTFLPGTLAVTFTRHGLLLHVVDRKLPVAAQARRFERRLARALTGEKG